MSPLAMLKRAQTLLATAAKQLRNPPPPPPPFHFTAIMHARRQSIDGPPFGVGECLMRVRMCYGIAPAGDFDGDGDADAMDAWERAHFRHRDLNPTAIPRGVPVFWSGGSHGHGHVAIATGDGKCWSTDILRPGMFDLVPISDIHAKWGLLLLGWTEDLNGVRVPRP